MSQDLKLNFLTVPWLRLVAVGISVDIYAMVGEGVYGQGTDRRENGGRTNDDREKDVVPLFFDAKFVLIFLTFGPS